MNFFQLYLVYNINYFIFTKHFENYHYGNRKIISRKKFRANY